MSDQPEDGHVDAESIDHEAAEDVGADTETWRAFASSSSEADKPKAVGAPFRILTLLGGLVVFALIVLLLLR